MVQRTWTDADLSAYVDGCLTSEECTALEAVLAQDAELIRQVEGIRQVKAMLRGLPLCEPPRNYLLTPSMVKTHPSKERRTRFPLFVMRTATALTTAAFAVTLALNLLVRIPVPAMVGSQAESLAYSAPSEDSQAAGKEAESVVETTEEAPMMLAAPAEPAAQADAIEAPASDPVEESRQAPAPEPVAEGASNADETSLRAADPEGAAPPPDASGAEGAVMLTAAEELTGTEVAAVAAQVEDTAAVAAADQDAASAQQELSRPVLPIAVPIALGALALAGVGLTLWFSRRR